MLRDVNMDEISDGKLYTAEDVVRITSDGCRGCSECCRIVGDTIVLDPLDIFNLSKALNKSFAEMMEKEIELRMVDSCILPNIMMQEETDACGMLDENGRCTIHKSRPGFCRLFPLGRIYDEEGDFKYFVQVHECPYPKKGDVKIADWLGVSDVALYEKYVKDWHSLCRNINAYAEECKDPLQLKKANWMLIRLFYEKPYDLSADFYPQFYARLETLTK